ncbi:hypothetical protein QNM99_24065 [Pseudomonas sp. PCH446]
MNTYEFDDNDVLIAEFESDTQEAIDAALEDLLAESATMADSNKDSLANKLRLCPSGDFPVSDHSHYYDPEWLLHHADHSFPSKVKLDREIPGSNDLKRALLYYLIPDFSPQGNVKSYTTTKSRAYEYSVIDDFIFSPNNLTAHPRT